MSRSFHAMLALLLVGGVVAALVRAQDTGPRRVDGRSATAAIAADTGAPRGKLVQHLQDVGQSISAEFHAPAGTGSRSSLTPPNNLAEPGLLLAANDAQSGALRSVLTRRTTLDDRPAARDEAAPRISAPQGIGDEPQRLGETLPREAVGDGAQRLGATLPREAVGDGAQRLGATVPREAVGDGAQRLGETLPRDAATSRASDVEVSDSSRTSSRRTYREPDASVSPPLVASKPISARPAQPASEHVSHATSDTLASTTGALLRVATVGPNAVAIGTMGEIAIYLSNLGSSEARDVTVRVNLPNNLEMISAEVEDGSTRMQREATGTMLIWTVDRVPARAERVLTLKAIPRTTEPLELLVDWSLAPVSSVARIQVQQPRLELALRGPNEIVHGETKVFTVTVSNPGTGDARNVSLRLGLGAESAETLQVGTIAAGGSREFQVEVTARQAGPMQILARAEGADELAAEAQESLLVRRADLKIETLGSGMKYAGSVGTYQVRIANQGDAAADQVRASVRLPLGAKYVQGLEQAEEEGNRLHWPVGSLAPGEERTYRFFCQLNEEGEARFEFVVRDAADLQATGNVTTQIQTIADLKMLVHDPKGPVPVGKVVAYEIEVTNRGTKEATQVQVIAQFSEGIEPAAAEGARAEIVPGQVLFQPIARLNAGQTIKLTVKAKAEQQGNHLFRAELRCGDPEYRLVSENTTAFFADDLTTLPFEPTRPSPSDAADSPAPLTGVQPGWTTR